MEFKEVSLGTIKLVGFEERIKLSQNKIQSMWSKFLSEKFKIKEAKNQACYGVASEVRFLDGDMEFTQMVGVEVTEFKDTPQNMTTKTLPPSKYLVFTHKGKLTKEDGTSLIKDTYEKIYGDILPNLNYEILSEYNFEYYDDRFIFEDDSSEFDIYIPILKK